MVGGPFGLNNFNSQIGNFFGADKFSLQGRINIENSINNYNLNQQN